MRALFRSKYRRYKDFLIRHRSYATEGDTVSLTEIEEKKLRAWCKRSFTASGRDNINHFLVVIGYENFWIDFDGQENVTVRTTLATV